MTDKKCINRRKELYDAAQPLLDYLYKYGTPHDIITVTQGEIQHFSGEVAVPLELRD